MLLLSRLLYSIFRDEDTVKALSVPSSKLGEVENVNYRRTLSRDSTVYIATGQVPDGRGVGARVPVRARPVLGPTLPPIQWVFTQG
jgi:hypothetical protein